MTRSPPDVREPVEQCGRRAHVVGERPVGLFRVEHRLGQFQCAPGRQLRVGPQAALAQRPYGGDEFAADDKTVRTARPQGLTCGERGEARLLLDAPGEYSVAERGGRREGPQVTEGGRGGVLQDHHAGGRGFAVGEEGAQAGVGGLVEGGEPGGGEPGHLGHGQPEVVQGQGELGLVEAAVVVRGHVLGGDQGVLGGGVDLDGEDVLQRVRRVLRGPVDLRDAPEAVRVLDPPERRHRPVRRPDQLPHAPGHFDRPAVRAGGVHGRGVRLMRPVDRDQRQRGDDLGGPDEPTQLVEGQRGLPEGERVAADEREGVVVVERLRLGAQPLSGPPLGSPQLGPPPRLLPHQRQPHLRQRRDVPRTHRPELVHHRVRPGLQRLAERRDNGGPQPGAAREELVGAHGEHGADLAGGELLADGSGVAAQEPQTVSRGGRRRHVLVPVGAHSGGAAVHAAARGDLPGRVPGFLDALHRFGAGDRPRGPVGEPDDVGDAGAASVQHHETGRHPTRHVHIPRRHRAQTPLNPDIGSCLAVISNQRLTPDR